MAITGGRSAQHREALGARAATGLKRASSTTRWSPPLRQPGHLAGSRQPDVRATLGPVPTRWMRPTGRSTRWCLPVPQGVLVADEKALSYTILGGGHRLAAVVPPW